MRALILIARWAFTRKDAGRPRKSAWSPIGSPRVRNGTGAASALEVLVAEYGHLQNYRLEVNKRAGNLAVLVGTAAAFGFAAVVQAGSAKATAALLLLVTAQLGVISIGMTQTVMAAALTRHAARLEHEMHQLSGLPPSGGYSMAWFDSGPVKTILRQPGPYSQGLALSMLAIVLALIVEISVGLGGWFAVVNDSLEPSSTYPDATKCAISMRDFAFESAICSPKLTKTWLPISYLLLVALWLVWSLRSVLTFESAITQGFELPSEESVPE